MNAETASIFCACIAAAASIAVAVIEHRASAERKKTQERAIRRARESRLSMELMSATCELSCCAATALRDGQPNSTLEPALLKAQHAQEDYNSFLKDEIANEVSKI